MESVALVSGRGPSVCQYAGKSIKVLGRKEGSGEGQQVKSALVQAG